MKTIKYLAATAGFALALAACQENDYKVYDTTQKDSVFFEYYNARQVRDSVADYNFGFDINRTHTVEIPVTLMGMPKDYDRIIDVQAVPDSSTMTLGKHYTVTDARIPAGEVSGTVKVVLDRDSDPALLDSQLKVRLVIGENEHLRSVKGSAFTILFSDLRPDQRPEWWIESTSYGAWPKYSFETAQIYFDYFYRLAPKANVNIFNEMINGYGDYFVKAEATQGPWTMYETFIRNYVFIPMYDDYGDQIEWTADPHW